MKIPKFTSIFMEWKKSLRYINFNGAGGAKWSPFVSLWRIFLSLTQCSKMIYNPTDSPSDTMESIQLSLLLLIFIAFSCLFDILDGDKNWGERCMYVYNWDIRDQAVNEFIIGRGNFYCRRNPKNKNRNDGEIILLLKNKRYISLALIISVWETVSWK